MGLLKGIKSRNIVGAVSTAALVLTLSGCEAPVYIPNIYESVTDLIKPDVNQHQRMLLDPNLVTYDFADGSRNIYGNGSLEDAFNSAKPDPSATPTPGETESPEPSVPPPPPSEVNPSGLRTPPKTWDRVVDVGDFEPTTTGFASSSVYTSVLSQHFDIVNRLIGNNKNVYFRVMHTGYDKVNKTTSVYDDGTGNKTPEKTTTVYKPGNYIDLSSYGTGFISATGGAAINRYIVDWLKTLEINKSLHDVDYLELRYNRIMVDAIDSGKIDMMATYPEVVGTEGAALLGSALMNAWNNCKTTCPTFGHFRSEVSAFPWDVLPDITLEYYTSWNTRSSVVLNSFSKSTKGSSQKDGTSLATIDVAFEEYNQFERRQSPNVDKWGTNAYEDESSLLMAYTDGYNKTLVYIAARAGMTLSEALGEDYSVVTGQIKMIPKVTDSSLTASGSNDKWVPAGVKGVS